MSSWVMPHQPRFDWQLWFSALGNIDSEYYLVHFLYKLLNDDKVARELISFNPFEGSSPPKYLKVDLDHYQFTDYKRERVTFGLKWLFSRVPQLLPSVELQRYFLNDRVYEKLTPTNWWVRSDSPSYKRQDEQ